MTKTHTTTTLTETNVLIFFTHGPSSTLFSRSSSKGVTGLNPNAHGWDVPLEVRCATNDNLTAWGPPQWLYDVYFYRGLPYDPVRPWKDTDGYWYSALSTDGCNATTRAAPCGAGGRLDLFRSTSFNGPWTQVR